MVRTNGPRHRTSTSTSTRLGPGSAPGRASLHRLDRRPGAAPHSRTWATTSAIGTTPSPRGRRRPGANPGFPGRRFYQQGQSGGARAGQRAGQLVSAYGAAEGALRVGDQSSRLAAALAQPEKSATPRENAAAAACQGGRLLVTRGRSQEGTALQEPEDEVGPGVPSPWPPPGWLPGGHRTVRTTGSGV